MYPHDARTPTDINAPEPIGYCDRCYRRFRLSDLQFQYDYRGNALVNLWLRVCPDDLDLPAETLRPIIIVGIEGTVRDPRPPQYQANFQGGTTPPTSPLMVGPETIP